MKCRRNVKSLTPDEKRRFVDAFVALKAQDSVIHPGSQSRYDDFAECHMNAMTGKPIRKRAHGEAWSHPVSEARTEVIAPRCDVIASLHAVAERSSGTERQEALRSSSLRRISAGLTSTSTALLGPQFAQT